MSSGRSFRILRSKKALPGNVKSTVDERKDSQCKKSVDRSHFPSVIEVTSKTDFISVNQHLVSPEIVLENKEVRAKILRRTL